MHPFHRSSLHEQPWSNVTPRPDIKTIADTGSSEFVRHIAISECLRGMIFRKGVDGFVEWADHELDEVALYCGATVIPHVWGLAKTPTSELEERARSTQCPWILNPIQPIRGYDLVARVPLITPTRSHGWEPGVMAGFRTYAASNRPYYYSDRKPEQYMYGTTHMNAQPRLWLTDIDLLFVKR